MDALAIRDNRTLRRIVTTLVALAVLAEQAAGRSYPVRCLVLFILRQAESVAGSFVAGAMTTPRLAVYVRIPPIPNSPADATGLAMRFRALAAALGALLLLARRFAGLNTSRVARRYGLWSGTLAITPGDRNRRPNDTS